MYTREQLADKLKKKATNIDLKTTCTYLKNWKIDPVYEDEDKVDFYDEMAILKLNQGILLKEQGKDDSEISSIINNRAMSNISIKAPSLRKSHLKSQKSFGRNNELRNLNVDITTQTLSLLAESIATKITNEITNKINDNQILKPVMDTGKLKRDNEILSQQVEKLLEENKKLITRNNFLQQENSKFKHLFGQLYKKQQ